MLKCPYRLCDIRTQQWGTGREVTLPPHYDYDDNSRANLTQNSITAISQNQQPFTAASLWCHNPVCSGTQPSWCHTANRRGDCRVSGPLQRVTQRSSVKYWVATDTPDTARELRSSCAPSHQIKEPSHMQGTSPACRLAKKKKKKQGVGGKYCLYYLMLLKLLW